MASCARPRRTQDQRGAIIFTLKATRSKGSARVSAAATSPLLRPESAPAPPPPSLPPSAEAGNHRIVRCERVPSRSLSYDQRSALLDRLYCVYSETMYGHTREQFERHLFSAGELTFALYYGTFGELAGFAFNGVQCVTHGKSRMAAFSGGGFFRPGYNGCGVVAMFFGLRQALRFKLRQPGTALGYLARTSSPVAYCLFTRTMPRVYPCRTCATPVEVDNLVQSIGEGRHYVRTNADSWVVRSDAIPRDASRMSKLDDHPDVRFYSRINPRFCEGDALLVWIPLNAANIVGGLYRQVRLRVFRWSQ